MSNTIRHRRIVTSASTSSASIIAALGLPGTENRMVKFGTAGMVLIDSVLFDNGTDVLIDSGSSFIGESGEAILDFGASGTEYWSLSRDGKTAGTIDYTTGWTYGDANLAQLGYSNTSIVSVDDNLVSIQSSDGGSASAILAIQRNGSFQLNCQDGGGSVTINATVISLTLGQDNHTQIELKDNSAGNTSSGNITKYSTFIGTQNSGMPIGVTNSVVLGGNGLYARTNDTAYVNQIGYATGSSFETLLQFTAPTADNIITFKDASGTIAFISDLPTAASGTYTPTGSTEVNLDAAINLSSAQYLRVGNTVTVSGRFTADPTTTTLTTSFEMQLPIVSDIGAVQDVAGVAFCGNIVAQGAEVTGVVATNRAKIQWKAADVTSQSWSYIFTYRII